MTNRQQLATAFSLCINI